MLLLPRKQTRRGLREGLAQEVHRAPCSLLPIYRLTTAPRMASAITKGGICHRVGLLEAASPAAVMAARAGARGARSDSARVPSIRRTLPSGTASQLSGAPKGCSGFVGYGASGRMTADTRLCLTMLVVLVGKNPVQLLINERNAKMQAFTVRSPPLSFESQRNIRRVFCKNSPHTAVRCLAFLRLDSWGGAPLASPPTGRP